MKKKKSKWGKIQLMTIDEILAKYDFTESERAELLKLKG